MIPSPLMRWLAAAADRLFDECCFCHAPLDRVADPMATGSPHRAGHPRAGLAAFRTGRRPDPAAPGLNSPLGVPIAAAGGVFAGDGLHSRPARRPPVCAACLAWFPRTGRLNGSPAPGPATACPPADSTDPVALDGDKALCLACGTPCQDAELADACCHRCRQQPAVLSRIIVPFRYQWPVDRLIGRLKYREKRHLAPLFGGLLANEVQRVSARRPLQDEARYDRSAVMLPVPLHPGRRASRGFNQADDIAHWCSRALGLSCQPDWVQRVEQTGSLATLGRAGRALTIRGAFTVDAAVAGRRVIIVDDVLTTGATSTELARECLDSGASAVELWAVARTVAHQPDGDRGQRQPTLS